MINRITNKHVAITAAIAAVLWVVVWWLERGG